MIKYEIKVKKPTAGKIFQPSTRVQRAFNYCRYQPPLNSSRRPRSQFVIAALNALVEGSCTLANEGSLRGAQRRARWVNIMQTRESWKRVFALCLWKQTEGKTAQKILFLVITMQRTRQKTLSFGAACFT